MAAVVPTIILAYRVANIRLSITVCCGVNQFLEQQISQSKDTGKYKVGQTAGLKSEILILSQAIATSQKESL